jgi:hypothetical protein
VVWKYEYDFELKAVKSLPQFANSPDERKQEAKRRVKEKRRSTAAAIEAQYRRTEILREALGKAPDQPTQTSTGQGHLVRHIEASARQWRASVKYKEGIEVVREWKRTRQAPAEKRYTLEENSDVSTPETTDNEAACHAPNGDQQLIAPERLRVRECVRKHTRKRLPAVGEEADYNLECDVNSYLIQYTRAHTAMPPQQTSGDTTNAAISRTSTLDSLGGGGLEPTDAECFKGLKGHFPDQRISIECLLDPDSNVLSQKQCDEQDPTRIRYFHVPSNNMEASAPPTGLGC